MSEPLRAALEEWDSIEGSDLSAQFRAIIAAGKMADAIRAALAAEARPGLDVRAARHAIVQASINLANGDTVSAHGDIEQALAALAADTTRPGRCGCGGDAIIGHTRTKAGRATVIRRAMQNGVDLTDTAAMAVIAADILAIEAESRNATLDEVVRAVEGLETGTRRFDYDDGDYTVVLGSASAYRAAVLDAVKALRP